MDIVEIIKSLEKEGSTLAKEQILRENKRELLKDILYYTYNPFFNYGLTRKTIEKEFKKIKDLPIVKISSMDQFFELLNKLNLNNINNDLRKEVAIFLLNVEEDLREIMIRVMCKNIQAGINTKLINKVFDNIIPVFEVQLAKKFEHKYINNEEIFYITEKKDGIRAVNLFNEDKNQWSFKSRQGKEINNLNKIYSEIEYIRNVMNLHNILFDGELIHHVGEEEDITSDDNYTRTVSIVNSDSEEKNNIEYHIFDVLKEEEFFKGESQSKYSQRRKVLDEINDFIVENNLKHIKIVPVLYVGRDISKIPYYLDLMIKDKKEGVMINLDTTYKCKRNDGILKVKEMYTMDLEIIGCEEGQGEFTGTLGAIIVDFKGYTVNVGSGFSKEERANLWNNKQELIGRIAEVKYFRISKNKNGDESLRFPIFKSLREIGKEVSCE